MLFLACHMNTYVQRFVFGGQVSDLDKGVIACGAHRDFGLVTILKTVSAKHPCTL